MKTSQRAALSAAILAIGALASASARAQTNPSIPVGSLSAFPTVVQTGTKPTLTWSIEHPSIVKTVVDIDPDDGTVTPKVDLYVDVRVLGAMVGNGSDWYKVQAFVKADGASSWTTFFNAKQTAVNPTQIYYTKFVRQARPIDFRGRVASNNSNSPSSWQSYYSTGTTTNNVRALVNGDSPPNYVPAFSNQSAIKSILAPYLVNGKIAIGPMDVIFLFELWGTQTNQSYFDMQDLVVLATFRTS